MKSTGLFALALALLLPSVALAQAQHKKKHSVPAIFNNARYVWVESMDGDIFTPDLLPADRQAISDVQNALSRWGRYVLTADRSDAELIFVVRTGRIAEGRASGSAGPPNSGPVGNPNPGQPQYPVGPGVMLGASVGPPDDLLEVILPNSGEQGTQVWFRSEPEGLSSPGVPLFQELKTAVDHDYPR